MENNYCTATHPNALEGCYERPNHNGPHWCYSSKTTDPTGEVQEGADWLWYWTDPPKGFVFLTQEELGILLTALDPIKQFFPELLLKLTDAREATK